MKLSEYKRDFYDYSGRASEAARTIAFAGIAIVWVFRISGPSTPRIPHELILPGALLALGLGLDLLHYIAGSVIWWAFHRYHERKLDESAGDDPELSHSPFLVLPIHALFISKLAIIVVAYFFLAKYLWIVWADC